MIWDRFIGGEKIDHVKVPQTKGTTQDELVTIEAKREEHLNRIQLMNDEL